MVFSDKSSTRNKIFGLPGIDQPKNGFQALIEQALVHFLANF